MATDRRQWLDSLKAGDDVAVFDYEGSILRHTTKVVSRTPTGRIVCDGENAAFKSDGFQIGSRSGRGLRPITQ